LSVLLSKLCAGCARCVLVDMLASRVATAASCWNSPICVSAHCFPSPPSVSSHTLAAAACVCWFLCCLPNPRQRVKHTPAPQPPPFTFLPTTIPDSTKERPQFHSLKAHADPAAPHTADRPSSSLIDSLGNSSSRRAGLLSRLPSPHDYKTSPSRSHTHPHLGRRSVIYFEATFRFVPGRGLHHQLGGLLRARVIEHR
jgi:hypothetical protein